MSGVVKTIRPPKDNVSYEGTGVYTETVYTGVKDAVINVLHGASPSAAGLTTVNSGEPLTCPPGGSVTKDGITTSWVYCIETTTTYTIEGAKGKITTRQEIVKQTTTNGANEGDDEYGDWDDNDKTLDRSCSCTLVETSILNSPVAKKITQEGLEALQLVMRGKDMMTYKMPSGKTLYQIITNDPAADEVYIEYINKGIETYMDPRFEVTFERRCSTPPEHMLQSIRDKIAGVELVSDADWMVTGVNWNRSTKVAQITYTSSGPGGWNKNLYKR